MEIRKHFGVYGVCYENNKLLCIKKVSGPYKNRYDLPGGSQKLGEGLTETLIREVFEETGFLLEKYKNSRIYDVFVKEQNKEYMVHHIMACYDIKIKNNNSFLNNSLKLVDEENDSLGICWVAISDITELNASPVVLKIKEEIFGKYNLDKSIYNDWKIIE